MDIDDVKLAISMWLMVVVITLTAFGLIKIGSNMFDLSNPNTPQTTGDASLNCAYRGGTVVAENGEYKECRLGKEK